MSRWLLMLLYLWLPASDAQPAERIISLAPHITEQLYAIGAGDQLVGVTEQCDYPPQAQHKPRVAGYQSIDIERILALKPDLVIAWLSGNRSRDLEALQRFGIPIAYSDPHTLSDISTDLRHLGRLTGHEAQAERVARGVEQQLALLATRYRQRPKVKVFYQLWSSPLMSVSADSWIGPMLALCGADNLFADTSAPYPQVSVEQVVAAAPEVILTASEAADSLDRWRDWPRLPATAHQHLYLVDGDLLHRYTPRTTTGIAQMCRLIDRARADQRTEEKSR